MRLNKVFISCALAFSSFATCAQPLQVTGFGPVVTQPLAEDVARITASAALMTTTIQLATKDAVSAIHVSGSESSKATLSAASKNVTDGVMTSSLQLKSEMDFLADIEARKMMSSSKLISDETHASASFVEDFLRRDDIKNLNIAEAVDYAKLKVDKNGVVVEPPVVLMGDCKTGDSKCEKLKNIGFERNFLPSSHIEIYAEMCSSEKRQLALKSTEVKSRVTTNIESAKRTQSTLTKTNPRASQSARLKSIDSISCTPERVEKGLCGKIDKSSYVDKVLKNEIIPNGDISATNFYAPSSIGGSGVIDINSPKMKELVDVVSFDALEKTNEGKQGLPEVVYTYRNSSQLKAAESFVQNIVNLDAIANQPAAQRKSSTSVPFQSMYLSRAAKLDLVTSTLNESLADRRGEKLSNTKLDSLSEGEIVKEYDTGAGSLDQRLHNAQLNLDKFSSVNIDELSTISEGKILVEIYKSLVTENKAKIDELLTLQKQSILLGGILASEVNDPENINYMKTISR